MKADLSPDNSNIKIPACFLRLDVSHLIGMVAKWDCLRKKTAKVRQFYIRSIAQIYQMSDMQDITYLLKCILTIALSQEIGVNNSNDPVHSELCLRHVNRIIKQGVLVNDVLENDDKVEKEEDYETISASDDGISCWKTWSQKIFTTAKKLAEQSFDGDVLNALYNPTAASKLKDLITFIPLWTGIMRPHFKIGDTVAKSSPVEGAFSNLKNIVFKDRLPMRVDKFVIQHLNYLDGKLKLACAEHNKVKNIISDSETRPQSDSTVFSSIEEKTRRSTYTVSNKTSFSTTTKDDTVTINNITKQLSLNEIDKNASSPSWTNNEVNNEITETFTSFTVSSSLLEKKTKLSNSTVASELEFIVPYAKTSTPLKEDPQKEKNTFLVSNESENELNNKENWRGKDKTDTNKRKRKIDTNNEKYRKKLNYLDACADWDFLPNGPAVGIPLISNGNLCEPVHCDGIKVIVKDTCAFDSLLQVIMSAIATNPSYKEATCAIDSKITKLAERLLTDGKVTAAARIERARILRDVPIFQKSQYTRQLETVNANCNAAHLAEYILHPSYTRSLRCDTCKTTSERSFTFLNINIDIIFQNGPGHMQDAINSAINYTNYICKNCKKAQDYNLIYGPHVLIDMSILTDLNYIPLKSSKLPLGCMELNAISKRIEVRGIFYNLIGAIRYIGHTTTNGHYTGIVYIGLKWYEYDDLLRKRTLQSSFEIIPHVLIYIRQ